jgi:calcium permeable stress-gated cation channel
MANETEPEYCTGKTALAPGNKDIFVQLVLSFALGISAFTAFCVRDMLSSLFR